MRWWLGVHRTVGGQQAARKSERPRIGQLLGAPEVGNPNFGNSPHEDNWTDLLPRSEDRVHFRLLGRALSGECELSLDEWRKSRRALTALVARRWAGNFRGGGERERGGEGLSWIGGPFPPPRDSESSSPPFE